MPFLSIIIPVYNSEKYINKCLDSIVQQKYEDYEVICVNDGSTDNTLDILKKYAKEYHQIVVINQENKGCIMARKSGVVAAKGKYSIFVDSDDWITSDDAFLTIVSTLKGQECDVVRFSPEIHNDGLHGWDFKRYEQAYKNENEYFTGNNLVHFIYRERIIDWWLLCKVYKSDILKKSFAYINDVRITMCEDVYASAYISFFSKTYRSVKTKPLYTYRIGSGISSMQRLSLDSFLKYLEAFNVVRVLQDFFDLNDSSGECNYVVDFLKDRIFEEMFYAIERIDVEDLVGLRDLLLEYSELDFVVRKYSFFKHLKYKLLKFMLFGERRYRYTKKCKLFDNLKFLKNMRN